MIPLPRAFYERDARVVARDLLNKLVVRTVRDGPTRVVRILEVEAYCGSEDPGSHAYRGETPRNRVMFGPAGHLYVYFTYGMHWCANAVCGQPGEGAAVLLRAAQPVAGTEMMWAARAAARRERDLCSGPAKLCQALSITGEHDGADLVAGDTGVALADDGTRPPRRPGVSTRIGLGSGRGDDLPWRWFVSGSPYLSRRG